MCPFAIHSELKSRATAESQLRRIIANELARLEREAIEAIQANRVPTLTSNTERIIQALVEIASDEINRVAAEIGVEYDPTYIDRAARAWAEQYGYNLIRQIDENTREVVRSAMVRYTEAGGMTRGELVAMLRAAFDPIRADRIAVTETTRAYAQAQQIYQSLLREQGIEMERVWHTDADDLVCPICRPLNGKRESEWQGYEPPAHVNCRCWVGLRTKRVKD